MISLITTFFLLTMAVHAYLSFREIVFIHILQQSNPSLSSQAADYTLARIHFSIVKWILYNGFVFIMTIDGGLAYLYQGILHLPGSRYIHGIQFLLAVVLLLFLLNTTAAFYQKFRIDKKFSLSNMTITLFCADASKKALLLICLSLPTFALLLALMNHLTYWWLIAWLLSVVFAVFYFKFFFTLISPLFNRYTPWQNEKLKNNLRQLLEKCNFTINEILVFDQSRRSEQINAYVDGSGKFKRIILFDTLIKKLSVDELEAVIAHELGHAYSQHKNQFLGLFALSSLLGFFCINLFIQQPLLYIALHTQYHLNYLGIGLVILILPIMYFYLSPAINFVSRHFEYQADNFASKFGYAQHLQNALAKLSQSNQSLSCADKIYAAWFFTHPPIDNRIANLAKQTAANGPVNDLV